MDVIERKWRDDQNAEMARLRAKGTALDNLVDDAGVSAERPGYIRLLIRSEVWKAAVDAREERP